PDSGTGAGHGRGLPIQAKHDRCVSRGAPACHPCYPKTTARRTEQLASGWTDQRNDFAFVTAVDPEVCAVNRNDAVAWEQLAHANEAEICEIRVAVPIAAG